MPCEPVAGGRAEWTEPRVATRIASSLSGLALHALDERAPRGIEAPPHGCDDVATRFTPPDGCWRTSYAGLEDLDRVHVRDHAHLAMPGLLALREQPGRDLAQRRAAGALQEDVPAIPPA